jgi:tRNA U34 5-methylaminomethyl-2-thiouridine-forming methyltransferase MnmC
MLQSQTQQSHLQIVTTADGSNTIFNSAVGENYHSRHGALQESRHVFLEAGLKYFLNNNKKVLPAGEDLGGAVSILEVGFGTGLNFLLTAEYCIDQNIPLQYTGIEAYPLTSEMIAQTGYNQYVSPNLWQQFIKSYESALQTTTQLNNCQLQIANCKLLDFNSDKKFDVIYFDAFAAIHQPEMWEETAIHHTLKFLKSGGVFVTYAITGNLKRTIKSLGLKVEKAPGAPGKREMLRAVKYADVQMSGCADDNNQIET